MCDEILNDLRTHLQRSTDIWYPKIIDKKYAGYFSNLSYDFKVMQKQDKMIVTQARHIWTLSKLSAFFNNSVLTDYAFHGYKFLVAKMWDKDFGGFFTIRNRQGNYSDYNLYREEKRTYGNAFAIYGLASLYEITKNNEVLNLAKKTFYWIEKNAFDKKYNGYFQFLQRNGKPIFNDDKYKTIAVDSNEVGLKDQNSSIHLLEAYTELYCVWKSQRLKSKLENILFLIRDVIADERGFLNLFFKPDWKKIYAIDKNYELDHVSFGHDYETAYLMLEASFVLNQKDDIRTLLMAKKMLDHSIKYGWDKANGGFYDQGFYFKKNKCEIIKNTKVWWAQAEALNSLLLFYKIYPEEKKYFRMFMKQWEYIKKYLIDSKYGDWYWGSLEKEPFYKYEPKANIWKATYHTSRALMNCVMMLDDKTSYQYKSNRHYRKMKEKLDNMIKYWQARK